MSSWQIFGYLLMLISVSLFFYGLIVAAASSIIKEKSHARMAEMKLRDELDRGRTRMRS